MNSNQKFWLWFWMIVLSGVTMASLAIGKANEYARYGEAAEYKIILDKGFTPAYASCSVNHDGSSCALAKEEIQNKTQFNDSYGTMVNPK